MDIPLFEGRRCICLKAVVELAIVANSFSGEEKIRTTPPVSNISGTPIVNGHYRRRSVNKTQTLHGVILRVPSRRNITTWGTARTNTPDGYNATNVKIRLYRTIPTTSIARLQNHETNQCGVVKRGGGLQKYMRINMQSLDISMCLGATYRYVLKIKEKFETKVKQGFALKQITSTYDLESTTWSLVFLSRSVLSQFQCTTVLNIAKTSMILDLAQPNPRGLKKKAPEGKR